VRLFYILLVLLLMIIGSVSAMPLDDVQVSFDTNPQHQHLTAVAIKITNEGKENYSLPNKLVNIKPDSYASECKQSNNDSYCGEHISTCVSGTVLHTQQTCLIWIAAKLAEQAQLKSEKIDLTLLPTTPWQKNLSLSYLPQIFVGGIDFNDRSEASEQNIFHPINLGNDTEAQALAVWNSDLVVGGRFALATVSTQIKNLALWNGNAWQAIPTPVDGGTVYSLAVWHQQLFVGGHFFIRDHQQPVAIATWYKEQWHFLDGGATDKNSAYVFATLATTQQLYIGGTFSTVGDNLTANNVASWNGEHWQLLGAGVNSTVFALQDFKNAIYVGGEFTQAGAQTAKNLAYWSQNSWHTVSPELNGSVYALTKTNNDLYVGGDFTRAGEESMNYVARWNKHSWLPLTTGVNNSVYSVIAYQQHVIVGGGFSSAGGVVSNFIADWFNNAWLALPQSDVSGYVQTQLLVPTLSI
jgi:hypothetical protein